MNVARVSAALVAVILLSVMAVASAEEPVERVVAALTAATDGGLQQWDYREIDAEESV